jgi:hypothetical protein
MVSLAAFRYGDVFTAYGGPIERVDTGELSVLGERHHLANAYLHDALSVGKEAVAIYGQADGTGIDRVPLAACHRAISAALVRWAYLAVREGPGAAEYGFGYDGSSNGMIAFPGLFRRQAQALARAQAVEQHALVSWWDGRLSAARTPTPYDGVEAVRIHHSSGPGEVVLLFRRMRAGYAYGHAYGVGLVQAICAAAVDLARAELVLAACRAKGALATPANFLERRALYFAGEEGAELFGRRLFARQSRPALPFRTVFDGEIPGPWARWATVWRCCAQMPTREHLEPEADFFFW